MKKNHHFLFASIYFSLLYMVFLNGCIPKKEIIPKSGTASFYTAYSDNLGTVTVTVDGTNVLSISNTSSYCTSYYSYYSSSYYLFTLTPGSHTYVAQTSDLSRKWTGTISITESSCTPVELSASTSVYTLPSGTSTLSGSTITDGSGIQIDLQWTVSPYYYDPESRANFNLALSNYSSYSSSFVLTSSSYSSSFQTVYIPYSGYSMSSISNGTYYIHVRPYYISSGYTGKYYLKVSGRSTSSTYTLNSSVNYGSSSSFSYSTFAKIYKSGNSFTVSLY